MPICTWSVRNYGFSWPKGWNSIDLFGGIIFPYKATSSSDLEQTKEAPAFITYLTAIALSSLFKIRNRGMIEIIFVLLYG